MASSRKATDQTAAPEESVNLLSEVPDEFELETVVNESPSKVLLEEVGDRFFGQFVEIQHIDNPKKATDPDEEDFDLFVFRGRDNELYALNNSTQLAQSAAVFDAGEWYLITLVSLIPGRKGNPLKNIRVQRAKRKT